MAINDVELLEGRAGGEPALEVALPPALLTMVSHGQRGPVLRHYRPPAMVAFGRRDALLPGFRRAAAIAVRLGFTPVIRSAGGRAAAFDEGCIVFDEIMPTTDSTIGIRARFEDEANRLTQALRRLGADARVGEVAGEYCPGEYTVNARGVTKLVGTAQRIVRGAWLFSTVVVVRPANRLRDVLERVYGELELAWDPRTFGSVTKEVPGVTIEEVERALLQSYARRYRLTAVKLSRHELAAAAELLDWHRVSIAPGTE
ncbi:MAG: lipoate--protein ligase family protein [Solirubrobacterales bacterium]|nr:lipoate--protein ligase family protein [Solirubrobacterales bacterium]